MGIGTNMLFAGGGDSDSYQHDAHVAGIGAINKLLSDNTGMWLFARTLQKILFANGVRLGLIPYIVAQVLHETGGMTSRLVKDYNLSGIKYTANADYKAGNGYAGYKNVNNWAKDMVRILKLNRSGQGAPLYAKDGGDYYRLLKANGYFEAPLATYTKAANAWLAKANAAHAWAMKEFPELYDINSNKRYAFGGLRANEIAQLLNVNPEIVKTPLARYQTDQGYTYTPPPGKTSHLTATTVKPNSGGGYEVTTKEKYNQPGFKNPFNIEVPTWVKWTAGGIALAALIRAVTGR